MRKYPAKWPNGRRSKASGGTPRRGGRGIRRLAGLVTFLVGLSVLVASPASAFIFIVPSPSFPDTVTVGETFSATVGIGNFSTPPESVTNPVLPITDIDLVPSCANFAFDCTGGIEPGVFALSPTAVGSGNPSCTGTWTITEIAPGRFRFTPPGGGPLQLATGEVCTVNFTATSLRVPSVDVQPAIPGVQTAQVASATALPSGFPPVRNSGSDVTTVLQATPTIVTLASPTVGVGGPIFDTATLSGGGGPGGPTGTITFNLFGPADPTCAGPPVFVSTVPVSGNGTYQSAPFITNAVGTYRWTATYSGDANNFPAGPTACGDPLEQVTVTQVNPTIVTVASPPVPLGGTITDTATLSGGFVPTGTITFNLFGPGDVTCAGPPIFTSTVPVAGNGSYVSAPPFTVTAGGTYRWTASYSGDANNAPAASPCNAPNEAVGILANPTIVTVASPSVPVGGQVFDTATLSSGLTPTGTITFNLFGPDNNTCTGPPAFTATVPVNGNGPYQSPSFTPTLAGTYRWVASYSGDANNTPAGPTACLDPAEAVVVTPANPTIITNASADVPLGGQVRDTATLSGGVNPTGTITFNLFGPNDATCAGPPAFTATIPVNGNGNYDSPFFTPTVAGTYRWVASYSGDVNNAGAGPTACLDPAEDVLVSPAGPQIVTVASPSVPLGGQVSDTANLSGGVNPTGTITFQLFGPNDATCAGPPVFVSTVPVNGNGAYNSGPFTPTAAGTYRFVATYSGDVNNASAGPTACNDPAEQVVVAPVVLPTIMVEKTADPLSRPEPGGDFTFTVVVTNTSAENLTITSLTDDVYGNLTTRPGSTCNTAIGTVLDPAETYSCTFTGPFTGPPGASQTDVVTATAVDESGDTVTDTDDATVTIFNVVPQIIVSKEASPASRPEPGGDFTFTVVVTNNGPTPVTITSLTDDVYGNITTRPGSTCNTAIGTVLDPAESYTCAFTGPFTGQSGDTQIDVVTATAVDQSGDTVTDTDDATVTITPAPGPTTPTLVTQASAGGVLGTALTDLATLSGGEDPTGTITFNLFGPDNPTCTGPPIFADTQPVTANGNVASDPFTPTVAGTYRWVASYSGDADNNPVATACGDLAETVVVTAAPGPGPGPAPTPAPVVNNTNTNTNTNSNVSNNVNNNVTNNVNNNVNTNTQNQSQTNTQSQLNDQVQVGGDTTNANLNSINFTNIAFRGAGEDGVAPAVAARRMLGAGIALFGALLFMSGARRAGVAAAGGRLSRRPTTGRRAGSSHLGGFHR